MAKKAAKKAVSLHADRELDDATAGLPGDALPIVCPIPSDPAMGDKTPEVMAWYRDHAPGEYERRYANRVIPDASFIPAPEPLPPDQDDEDEDAKPPKNLTD